MRMPAFRRPRYAEVSAALAVIVALGGTSYAVTAVPRNSVGTTQLKPHAVTKSKLATGLSTIGLPGPVGSAGPAGAPGATGASVPGISGYEIVIGPTTSYEQSSVALCSAGKRPLGGGGTLPESTFALFRSVPYGVAGWAAQGHPDAQAYAICATVS
jgi:hypothetical protein